MKKKVEKNSHWVLEFERKNSKGFGNFKCKNILMKNYRMIRVNCMSRTN